MVCTLWNPI
uniref:Uncharacterized protein n=1 Tax=Rhizophora mucronata TaxID=61149 RepID=A0A2P2QWL6_RHIMU